MPVKSNPFAGCYPCRIVYLSKLNSILVINGRSYVLQCGLSASEQEITRQDSDFVRDAISAAMAVMAEVESGLRILEIPSSIADEKFVLKLKQGQGTIPTT